MTPIPESIVVSLEWAKRLKEAGWPQGEAIFYWEESPEPHLIRCIDGTAIEFPELLAAPTAEEILRRLPACMIYHRNDGRHELVADDRILDGQSIVGHAETLADACSMLYCSLASSNLL